MLANIDTESRSANNYLNVYSIINSCNTNELGLLGSAEVLSTISGVNLNHLSLFDKDRDLNNSPGFNRSSLCYVGSRIALNSRLSLDDLKVYEVRSFNRKCISLVELDCSSVILSDELDSIVLVSI